MKIKSVCVYCASNRNTPEPMRKIARSVGEGLARRGIRLVYGGASIGMMGEVADAVIAGGGEVVGVIPENLMIDEVAHNGLTELIVTDDMHSRKMTMFGLSDAFISLPGGLGTLEETLEIITWRYLGIHIRPVIMLNHEGFFDHLLAQFERCRKDGVMREGLERLWTVCASVGELFDILEPEFPVET